MSKTHTAVVTDQFGPRAHAYVESMVHAQGEDLDALAGIIERLAPARALDLGSGGGHVAYRMALHAQSVMALDISTDMLAAVAATAQAKGLSNIETVQAPVERLPFEDATFDFLASRFSAHHWHDFEAGLRQARRVVELGGKALFIDVCAPQSALLDTHLQAIELLRDGSHVRNYTVAEWIAALARAGFSLCATRTWRLRMKFDIWTARMQTPALNKAAIRALQQAAPAEVQLHFANEEDGSFMLDAIMLETIAA
jgi:SAM-dependent methyltransferase